MGSQIDPNQFTTPFLLTPTCHRDPYLAISPDNPKNFQPGKVIIITGGSSGIGAAAAKVWARAGAQGIVIAARRLDSLEKVAKDIKAINSSVKVLTVQVDISNEEDIIKLFKAVHIEFGRAADVLLNNAGYLCDDQMIGETKVEDWWKSFEINLKGLYMMTHHYIQSQPLPTKPVGTIITVSSGRSGITNAGGSSYNISKLAEQRMNEHVQMEYPDLRVFTTMPGISHTDMTNDFWMPFALDHVDLIGMLSLYLVQPRADYLKGGMVSVNWDVEEMEKHKKEILEKKLLQTSWLPILPFNGGSGLRA